FHTLSSDNKGINCGRIGKLYCRDWELWRTVTGTLRQLETAARHNETGESERALFLSRVHRLLGEMDAAPKSRKWKLRDRVGERVQWYVLPEEPNEAVDLRSL